MICSTCQTPNRDIANFCRQCGTLLTGHCPRCSTAAPPDSNYCDHCGLPLTPRAQVVWSPEQPVSPVPLRTASPAPTAKLVLQQYIPNELLAKLEAAQARGAMLGERRIVTMLFCDVKGSTRAAEELDPEEWSEVINSAFEFMIRPFVTG